LPKQLPRNGGASDGVALSLPSCWPRQPAHGSAQFAGFGGPTLPIAHLGFAGGQSSTRRVVSELSRFRRAWSRSYGVSRRSWLESEMVGYSHAPMALALASRHLPRAAPRGGRESRARAPERRCLAPVPAEVGHRTEGSPAG